MHRQGFSDICRKSLVAFIHLPFSTTISRLLEIQKATHSTICPTKGQPPASSTDNRFLQKTPTGKHFSPYIPFRIAKHTTFYPKTKHEMPQNIVSSPSKQAFFRRKNRHFSTKVSTPNTIAVNSSPAKSLLFPSEVPFPRPESSKKLSDKLRFFYFNCQHFATPLSDSRLQIFVAFFSIFPCHDPK